MRLEQWLVGLVTLSATPTMARQQPKPSRRDRIRAMLANHKTTSMPVTQEKMADDPFQYNSYQPSLPPIYNMWVTWDPAWDRRLATPTTKSTTTTLSPAPTTAEHWYYQDDWGQVQGPYSAGTMLGWEQGGYFRPGLYIRRGTGSMFSTLAAHKALYGRSPFYTDQVPTTPPPAITSTTLETITQTTLTTKATSMTTTRTKSTTTRRTTSTITTRTTSTTTTRTTSTTTTRTTTTTPDPPPGPYDLWYYKDNTAFIHGPFSSQTMDDWDGAGYFRSHMLLRREVDNIFSNLATYWSLYGRSPFSRGSYPAAIIVYTTSTTITTTTTSTTTSTTTTTTSSTTATTTHATTTTTTKHTTTTYSLSTRLPATEENISESNPVKLPLEPMIANEGPSNSFNEEQSVKWGEDATKVECEEAVDCRPYLRDGSIRLSGGRDDTEGNVEIYHQGIWGGICDDEWDTAEARIACKELGYPGVVAATHGGSYGHTPATIWMDNMYCYGGEKQLYKCRFDGWGVHDCDRTEAAGVRCEPRTPPSTTTTTTTPRPKIPMAHVAESVEIRLAGGRVEEEGRVELRFDAGLWGVACGDGWGTREAMVACRQLGMKYAAASIATHMFGGANMTRVVSGLSCRGDEDSLLDCEHDQAGELFCPGEGGYDIAGVVCTDSQADLEPDLSMLMTSAHLEDKALFLLQCAMEENCLASQAYEERQENPYWQHRTRRLLRFTTAISNIGSADFRPFIPKSSWQWHACHMHFHSMETFSHFEILNWRGERVVEGHKASFCLEDNDCVGVEPHYDCENYGDQGITAGCKDIYYYNIDCQWIDITELEAGTYVFKMSINPEYKIPEISFENNAALCTLYYSQMTAVINNCTFTRP